MTGTRSIVVHPSAASLRRELGAQAWSALEVLVAASEQPVSVTVAMSVRVLAMELRVSKNTASRALATLTAADLVSSAAGADVDRNLRCGQLSADDRRRTHHRRHFDPSLRSTARSGTDTASPHDEHSPRDRRPTLVARRGLTRTNVLMNRSPLDPINDRQVPARGRGWSR